MKFLNKLVEKMFDLPFSKNENGTKRDKSFIALSIWNKATEVLKKTSNINTFKHNLRKYYLTQIKKAEIKLSYYYQNYYNYYFANYVLLLS